MRCKLYVWITHWIGEKYVYTFGLKTWRERPFEKPKFKRQDNIETDLKKHTMYGDRRDKSGSD
jgi:hypothetical protein